MTNRQRGGELVDKARLIQKLEPVVIAFRESSWHEPIGW